MRLQKLSAAFMAAILVTTTPAGAYLGQMTSFAKEKEEKEPKNYDISDAAWDEETDADGKVHVWATWSESDDRANANISIYVDDKKQSVGNITAYTTAGKKDLTSYIRKINKKGTYTFKITSSKKSDGADEKSSSESDTLEIDSDYLKNLAKTSGSSGSGSSSSSTPGSSTGSGSVSTSGSSPADAMNAPAAGQTAAEQTQPATQWQDWGYGWVYFRDGQLVTNEWIAENGKYYHINATGFMDVNTYAIGTDGMPHFVGPDGALVY